MARVAQPAQPSQGLIVASWTLFEVAQSAFINASAANAYGPIEATSVGRTWFVASASPSTPVFGEKLVVLDELKCRSES